jgi:molecular chaperone DnaJ
VARTCTRCHGSGRIISKPCAACKGEGRALHERKLTVKVPPGIADGQRLRITGEGEGGPGGGPAGDLYVFIEVAPHAFFRREGNNLACEIPLNFTTLALGGSIDIPTLEGHESFKIPEGTQSGTMFRLRGKGMPDVSGRGRGDLFFTAQAVTPKKLTKEQRTLLEQLNKALPKETFQPRPLDGTGDEKNLFEKVKDIFG